MTGVSLVAMIGMSLHSCAPAGPQIQCTELGQTYSRKDLRDLAMRGLGDGGPPNSQSSAAMLCLARAGDSHFELLGARAAYNLSMAGDRRSSEYRRESCGILRRCSAYDTSCASDLSGAECPASDSGR